jgi:hypothetical protein
LILALALGSPLVPTTAAVANPTQTASFSTAATAKPPRISALGHNAAGMEFARSEMGKSPGEGCEKVHSALPIQGYLSGFI